MHCQDATSPKPGPGSNVARLPTPASSAGNQIETGFVEVAMVADDHGSQVTRPPNDIPAALPSETDESAGNSSMSYRAYATNDHPRSRKSKTPNDPLVDVANEGLEARANVPDRRNFSGASCAEASRVFAPMCEEAADHAVSEGLPVESSSRTQGSNYQVVRGVIVLDASLVPSNRRSRHEQHRGHKKLVQAQLYQPESRRWRLGVGLIALVVLVGVLGTGIGLGLSRTQGIDTGEDLPSAAPTLSGVQSEWIQRAQLFPSTLQALEIPDSPQSRALSWVLENVDDGYGSAPSFDREKQRFALASLYFALNGPESLLADDWMNLDQHECNWEGVTCSSDFLEALSLSGELHLQGSIAPEIGLLTALASLSINLVGGLKGGIPGEIGYNYQLTSLVLNGNGLTGSIPNEVGRFRTLVLLDLSKNLLTGTVPTEISNFTSLQSLRLHENLLEGPIPSVSQLTWLRTLNMYGNLLVGTVSTDLTGLTQLEQFHLSGNRLTGSIPASLGRLRNLRYVSLRGNPLSGTIPPELGQLSNLVRLHLDTTEITGTLPTEIFGMRALETLRVNDNQLSGSIPPHVGNLTSATTLLLDGNRFTGTIPTAWAGLSSLRELQMNGNDLSGPIPTELGHLSNLKVLLLQGNRNVTGTVPSELCSLTRDRGLNLTLDCEGVEFNPSYCPCQCAVDLFSDP